jgi:hypothetical protein
MTLAAQAANNKIDALETRLQKLEKVKLPVTIGELSAYLQKLSLSPLSLLDISSIPSSELAEHKQHLASKMKELKDRKNREKEKYGITLVSYFYL